MSIGALQGIWRYPVKSMGGEQVASSLIRTVGVDGDRSCGYVLVGREDKYATIQRFMGMAAYRAKLQEDGEVSVTTPTGQVYVWDDPALLAEVEAGVKCPIKPWRVRRDEPGAYFDDPILLTTDASLRAVSAAWGKGDLDIQRFRPNLVVALDEDQPFIEESWVGKEVVIGDLVMEIVGRCVRCSYLNIDPEDASNDYSVLKTVYNLNNNLFGVFAVIVQPAQVSVGDRVQVRERQDQTGQMT